MDYISSNLRREDLIENQLKQMINREDKKCLFLILRRDIKGTINPASIIRSSISRIDVTLEDGAVAAETTKEGIELHLLERNTQVYRAVGLTQFINTELGRGLGSRGSSPLAKSIL
jgi:hypothetical protein